MENQHRAIKGYRELSATEIDLMNEGKALAEACGAYVAKLRKLPPTPLSGLPANSEHAGGDPLIDQRWVSIGATDLQRGFMAITRGIAQPSTF